MSLHQVSTTAATETVAGKPVTVIDLGFTESVSAGTPRFSIPMRESMGLFAAGSGVVGLYGIELPRADPPLFRQLLSGLASRS